MENLELRMDVARALGCQPVMVLIDEDESLPCCPCDFKPHSKPEMGVFALKPCESDDHAGLDALKEFCEKGDGDRKYLFEILQTQDGRYRVIIFYRSTLECIAEKAAETLATAASLAIQEAAKEKKEAP